jgi:hypothetical protein
LAKLCKAGQQLREQIDDAFPDRSRVAPEGWLGDRRHAARRSDHNPSVPEGVVRAYDFNADLGSSRHEAFDLADQLRLLARSDKRISYVIFNGKIASWKRNYKWRRYTGLNPHKSHIHVSFTAKGDNDGSMFRIPLLTGEPINGRVKKNRRKLGQIISSSSASDISSSGLEAGDNSDQRNCCRCTCNNSIPKR